MKIPKLIIIVFLLGLSWSIPTAAFQGDEQAPEMIVKDIDAKKALTIANQWRWTRKEITSYVNTREVVFKFPNGNITKILLPENEIMVAVAPYIKNTHG